jgi:hypothetical protein
MKHQTDVPLTRTGPWSPGRRLRAKTVRAGERPRPSNVARRASRPEDER